ncbi:MAG: hypothetical protein II837_13070 [Treponema sp.]|nr:hypothetical protein [Treponema sp.]
MGSRVRGADQPELELFPRARLPRFDNPSTDNERLLTYQARWLEDGDEGARASLWELALVVADRCARGEFWKRHVRPRDGDTEDCAMEAVLYVMGRYASPATMARAKGGKPRRFRDVYGWNYCVMKDYVSVLAHGVRHAMDYRTKADCLVEFIPGEELELITGGQYEDYGMP